MDAPSRLEGLRLETLGRFRVSTCSREIEEAYRQPVRSSLFVYLAVEGKATRTSLVGLLWPDRPEPRARHALSQALYKLRRDLGTSWLNSVGETLAVTDAVTVDARRFTAAADCGNDAEAIALYEGRFLDGWHLRSTHPFEFWVDCRRESLSRLYARVVHERIRRLEAAGEREQAMALARRWVDLDPLREESQSSLIDLLVRLGRRSAALHRSQAYGELLRAEGLRPSKGFTDQVEVALGSCTDPGSLGRSGSVPPRKLADAGSSGVPPPSADRVLVLPFENRTGRDELGPLGQLAADWITEGLDRSGLTRIVPTLDVARSAADNSDPGVGERTSPGLRALARVTGAGTLVAGSVYLVDGELTFQARVEDLTETEIRGTIEPVSVGRDGEEQALERLRARVLGLLAANLETSWQGLPTAPELGIRPPAYDAYQAYASGVERFLRQEFARSLPCFEEAMALDPSFSRAFFLAAAAHMNLGRWDRVAPLIRSLESTADRLSPYERNGLKWWRARLSGDREEAHALSVEGWRRCPGTIAHFLAGVSALELGRPREAMVILGALDPASGWLRTFPLYWSVMTAAHHLAGNHGRELELARRGRAQFPSLRSVLGHEIRARAALGEVDRVGELLRTAEGLPVEATCSYGSLLLTVAEELRAHGHEAEATLWAGQAVERSERVELAGPFGSPLERHRARCLYAAERWADAEARFARLAREFPENLEFQGRLGTIAVRRGDASKRVRFDRTLSALDRPFLFGQDTLWRARMASLDGRGDRAADLLEQAFREGCGRGMELHADPDFEPLKRDPRCLSLFRPRG